MDAPLRILNTPPPFTLQDPVSGQLTDTQDMASSRSCMLSPPGASNPKRRKLSTEPEFDSQSTVALSSEDVLGRFSFGPTTQTTVVTTTTTTTTSFPPLKIKAPNGVHELDPKNYPLASAPTPQSLKKLCFELDGRPTVFREADDTLHTYKEVWLPPSSFCIFD